MKNLSDKTRIVIKVGTSTLTHKTGLLNIRRIELLAKVLSDLKNCGKEVVLVTSGAIGVGCGKLGLKTKPADTPTKQAMASIGQCELMYFYDRLFTSYNHTVAQVLMTKDIIEDEERHRNCVNTLSKLISIGVIPIINENDAIAVEEIEFGDNDTLSAIVADLVDADLLIILSDIDGLFNKNPNKHSNAKLIPEVKEITDEIIALAEGAGSSLGTGGMITKIHAAQIAAAAGIDMVIMNGKDPALLYDIFENKQVGTIFLASERS